MEEGEMDDHAVYTASSRKRRIPRTCVKNRNPAAYKDSDTFIEKPKRFQKRKYGAMDDDPIDSEVDDADDISDSTKKVPGYRCSPHLIPQLMSSLSDKQRGWVKNIGFDSFQHMIESRMPKSLTMWLVDRVDTKAGTLDVGGIPVDIRDAVVRILKLPCGNLKVPHPLNGRSKAKRPKGDTSCLDNKYSVNGRGTSSKDETKFLLAEQEDEEEFCRSFVMLVLCIYAAPTTSLNINRNYLPSLLDVSKIILMDWCGFIADYLIQGIRDYRDSTASHVQVPGCVHLLPLMYIDSLIMFKVLHLPESLQLYQGEPRIHFIGTQHLYMVASLDVKSRSKDHIEYGLLMESCNHESVKMKLVSEPESSAFRRKLEPVEHKDNPMGENMKDEEKDLLRLIFTEIKQSREQLYEEFKRKTELAEFNIMEKYLVLSGQRTDKTMKPVPPEANHNNQSSVNHVDEGKKNHVSASRDGLLQVAVYTSSCIRDHTPQSSSQTVPVIPEAPTLDKTIRAVHVPESISMVQSPVIAMSINSQVEPMKTKENSKGNLLDISAEPSKHQVCEYLEPRAEETPQNMLPERDDGHSVGCDKTLSVRKSKSYLEKKYSDSRTICDSLNEAVDIGAAAASEAICNHASEEQKFGKHGRLNVLSEAAYIHGSPMFDQSPATRRNCAGESPHDRSQPCSYVPQVSSNFPRLPGNTPFGVFHDNARPAEFDKSPFALSGTRLSHSTQTKLGIALANDEHIVAEKISVSTRTAEVKNTLHVVNSLVPSLHCTGLQKYGSPLSVPGVGEQPSMSLQSDSDDKTFSNEASPEENGDFVDFEEFAFPSNNESIESQVYPLDSQEVIHIVDDQVPPAPNDIIHIPPIQMELPCGARFKFGGTVTVQTSKMYQKFKRLDKNDAPLSDIGKYHLVISQEAKSTYNLHVINSSARTPTRFRHKWNEDRQRTKIQIKGFHITKGEFVDALKPKGEVCQALMGLCSVAIMADWESKSKIILDQAFVSNLMKDGHVCDHVSLAAKFRKMPLDDIDEIFLPILSENHWFLAVVNLVKEVVKFYDSLLVVKKGEHPHRNLWENMVSNLEIAYSRAKKKTFHIYYFDTVYAKTALQTTIHDCGYHVIRSLECYGAEDVVGYSKKKTMMPFRRYLSHTLIYHRFNDLNPLRPNLRHATP